MHSRAAPFSSTSGYRHDLKYVLREVSIKQGHFFNESPDTKNHLLVQRWATYCVDGFVNFFPMNSGGLKAVVVNLP